METLFSIARQGNELGEWTKEEVIILYHRGELVGTDYYWHEGLFEWRPLRGFIKPPIPQPSISPASPKLNYDLIKKRGLGRIGFALGFIPLVVLAAIARVANVTSGLPQENQDAATLLCALVSAPILLFLVALRFRNIGQSRFYCLYMFIPLINLGTILYCLFVPGAHSPSVQGRPSKLPCAPLQNQV